jgi:hypothetical protein
MMSRPRSALMLMVVCVVLFAAWGCAEKTAPVASSPQASVAMADAGPPEDEGPPTAPGGFGPGGLGGFGPPRVGELMPSFLQERLNLTPEQRKELQGLQKEVDDKLDKVLTDAQKKQLKEVREAGPRGPD